MAVLEAYVRAYNRGGHSSVQPENYSSWKDEWYDSEGKNVSTSSNLEDATGCGMTCSEYQTAYSKMLNSIKNYGGFWLAQYEAGMAYEKEGELSTSRTNKSPRITKPISANYAKDQYPYNFIYCSEAQKIANQDSTEDYISSLPFGIQWDLVCKFIEVKGAKTYEELVSKNNWGNTGNENVVWTSSFTSKYSSDGESFIEGTATKGSEHLLLTTGAIEKVKVDTIEYIANPMNIYDFSGNMWEYTLEHATRSSGRPCADRGGGYTHGVAASRDHMNTYGGWYGYIGFRSTLY